MGVRCWVLGENIGFTQHPFSLVTASPGHVISRFKMTGRVLVLNASFEPVNVCTERRAVVMIFKGIARMEEHNGHMLHSARITMHAPSVIRLVEYIHIPYKSRSLSRKNILLRDHSTCQYCGRQFSPSELTLDHVFPRSRGGESTWDNLVACCKRCNHQKGSRTPEEARMHLVRRPRAFSLHVNRQIMRFIGRADETWRKYLFYESGGGED
jgi:5-methylcytosine-specific restriction endonuclease McrA